MVDHMHDAGGPRLLVQIPGFAGVGGQRSVGQHVQSRVQRFENDRILHVARQRHDDGVNRAAVDHLPVIGEDPARAKPSRQFFGAGPVAPADGRHLSLWMA